MPVAFDKIMIGETYSRPSLTNIWGYFGYQALVRGVITPKNDNKIILFVTKEKQDFQEQYANKLDGNILKWEGPTDHFAEERMIKANESGEEIHVFYRERHHMDFIYLGQANLLVCSKGISSPSKFQFGLHYKEVSSFPAGKEKTVNHVFQKIGRLESDLDAISNHLNWNLKIKGADTGTIDLVGNEGLVGKKKDLATREELSKSSLDSIVAEKCIWLGITNLNEVAIFEVLDSKPEMIGETENVIELAVKKINPYMAIQKEEEVRLAFHRLLNSGFINFIDRSNRRLIFPNKVFWDRQTSELKLETLLIHEILLSHFSDPIYEKELVKNVCELMRTFHKIKPSNPAVLLHLRALSKKNETNSIELFANSNKGEEENHLVLWIGDRGTLSKRIHEIREQTGTERPRTLSKSSHFETPLRNKSKTGSDVGLSTNLSVKEKTENIMKDAKTVLHYKEVEDRIFERYGTRHSTNGILNSNPDLIKVLPGVFIHKQNYSGAFPEQFKTEKTIITEKVKNKLNSTARPLAIGSFSKVLLDSGELHCFSEKTIATAITAFGEIDSAYMIIPHLGNPGGKCIAYKAYSEENKDGKLNEMRVFESSPEEKKGNQKVMTYFENNTEDRPEKSQSEEIIHAKSKSNSENYFEVQNAQSRRSLEKGDFVIQPKRPDWGIGEVLETSTDYIEIQFSEEPTIKSFLRGKNSLVRIENPDFKALGQLVDKKTVFSKVSRGLPEKDLSNKAMMERVDRDTQNAQHAIEMAKAQIKNFTIIKEKPDIMTGFSKGYLASTQASASERASLEAVASNPFNAMLEVETRGLSSNKKQLWYANERINCNLPLNDGEKKVNILVWTHPGVQLALVEPLGEEHDIAAFGYNLTSVTPLARAKFWQLFPEIAGVYEPGGQIRERRSKPVRKGLKAVRLDMSRDQVKAFISKMNGLMLVSGAPGSGKTTVAMQRIRFLYDQQELRKEDLRNTEYSPELTRIFLANQNLIDFSKDILSKDLDIPPQIVELVPHFVHRYLNEIWTYKHNAQPRRKQLFFYDERGRQAFFGLCHAKQLGDCWAAYESQISERLARAETAPWQDFSGHVFTRKSFGKRISSWFNPSEKKSSTKISQMLVEALIGASKKRKSFAPADSTYKMDSLYAQVRQPYEDLRNKHGEKGTLEVFDLEFKKWLFWVYDPLDAITSYFEENFYEGGIRIKNGIAGKLVENDILDNIRSEWEERKYGDEQVPWLAFLLRFALPTESNPRERFRELPNPLIMGEKAANWTHIMIDEAQDLCVAEAALLSSFVHPDGALTVSADFHQVVSPVWGMENPDAFKMGSSLRDKGASMTYPFAKNMRQSKQIGMFLQAFYQNIFGELAPFECNETIEGSIPLLLICRSGDFAIRIKQRVAVLKRNPDITSIGLLQIDEDQKAMEQMRDSLQNQGLELAPIWAASDDANRIVTTSVERIKGLEYDVCFVVGMDNVENSALKHSKNRAYVALSRPARQLTMFCEEIPNSLQKISKDLLEIRRV